MTDAENPVSAVEEQLPPGWTAENIEFDGTRGNFDSSFERVKWFFGPADNPVSLTYRAIPSAGAQGSCSLIGNAAFYGMVSPLSVGGDVQTAVGGTPPTITQGPLNLTILGGENTNLTVTAGGAGLMYSWLKGAGAIANATSPVLSLTNVNRGDSGDYRAVVANSIGSVTSSVAVVRVLVPQQFESLSRLAGGQIRLRFRDDDGGLALADGLAGLEVWGTTIWLKPMRG